MKKPNTANTNDIYKLLSCVSGILFECIFRDTLLTIHEISQLDVALTSLKNVIESNQLNYPYQDVLTFEVSCFRERKIPYINHFDGQMEFATYEEAINEHTAISADGNISLDLNKKPSYNEGNLAIGQIYIGGAEYFSKKLALEHSLRSMALRWYNQIGQIKCLLSEKGVLENVHF